MFVATGLLRKSLFQPRINIHRINQVKRALPSVHFSRYLSTDVELIKKEDKNESDTSASSTGVIDVHKQSEVVLYFDHVYPMYASKYTIKNYIGWVFTFQSYYDTDTIKQRALQLANTPELPLLPQAKITEFIPVKRDGGAFLKFNVPPESTPKDLINQICNNISKNREKEPFFSTFRNFFYDTYPKAYQVKGTPWIEDLKRYPSPTLNIKFDGEALTEEELYLLFRRYGVIVDIIPQLSLQAYATIIYRNFRSAIVAKNCITGIQVNGNKTLLHIQYQPLKSLNVITDFIVNHQRVAIPIILALLATFAVLIFDPIREFFIEQKITHKYSIETYKDNRFVHVFYVTYRKIVRWISNGYDFVDDRVTSNCEKIQEIVKETTDGLSLVSMKEKPEDNDEGELNGSHPNILWMERMEKVKQLKLWIYENVNTFIVVKGPKGSGKLEFVLDHTLLQDEKLKHKILYIDCETLAKTRTDNAILTATAHQLGYFPLFTWTNTILQFIDLGLQSLTGQKSGLSETKETQLKNMFQLTIQAIRKAALAEYPQYKKAVLRAQRKRAREVERKGGNEAAANADPLEETSFHEDEVLKEEQYLQQHPELKPIIIINKFVRRSDGHQDFIYKMIAEWTSQVVQSNLAHVVYITHDVGSLQLLSDALPNQVFKTISLSDASVKSSKQYVINQLSGVDYVKKNGLDSCLQPIGGRMLDLQAFIRRVKSGETPDEAFTEMVNQAAEQITAFFLSKNNSTSEDNDHNWLAAQVWCLMKILAEKEDILYTDLCNKYPLFKTSPTTLATLSTLEKHDLISLVREKGVLNTISTGRPLFREAFKNLINDRQVFSIFESEYYGDLIAMENAKISTFEDEIAKISGLSDMSILKTRLQYVQEKIVLSTEKIYQYEAKVKEVAAKLQSLSKKRQKSSGVLSYIGIA